MDFSVNTKALTGLADMRGLRQPSHCAMTGRSVARRYRRFLWRDTSRGGCLRYPKVLQAAHEIPGAIHEITHAIEAVHMIIEGKKGDLEKLASDLATLANRSVDVNLPDDMPALPAPAHHR